MCKWFQNLKLQGKFFVILLLALLLVFCGSLLLSRMTEQTYNDALYERTVQLLTLFAQNVQSELDEVTEYSFSILADNVLQEKLSLLNRLSRSDIGWRETSAEINSRVLNMSFVNSSVVSLQLHTANHVSYVHSIYGIGVSGAILTDNAQAVLDAKGSAVWLPDSDESGYLYLLRDIREVEELSLQSLATLCMRVSMNRIVDRCVSPLLSMNMPLLCAIDFQGTRVYASDERLMEIDVSPGDFSLQMLDGNTFFCVPYTPSGSDWSYTAALPYDDILQSLRRSSIMATSIAALALALALIFGSLLISSIVRHFKLLIAKYDAFARGEQIPADEIERYRDRTDEIGELHRQFDRMTAEHQRMIDEIYVKQQLLLEAQMRQLRAQIQPHFLYNTLESITCLADRCADTRIATISTALGHMLRATLNDKRDMIPLREDIAITEEYLSIQRIRYVDQLWAEFQVDEPFLDALIPSMTLQPLVENAVRHGAEEMLEACEIRIYAQRAGRYIDITVEDNGPGMDEDILDKLASGELRPEGLGIGLSNIHQRLQLAFRDEGCGLRIRRENNKTHVIVRILSEVKPHDQAAAG